MRFTVNVSNEGAHSIEPHGPTVIEASAAEDDHVDISVLPEPGGTRKVLELTVNGVRLVRIGNIEQEVLVKAQVIKTVDDNTVRTYRI